MTLISQESWIALDLPMVEHGIGEQMYEVVVAICAENDIDIYREMLVAALAKGVHVGLLVPECLFQAC